MKGLDQCIETSTLMLHVQSLYIWTFYRHRFGTLHHVYIYKFTNTYTHISLQTGSLHLSKPKIRLQLPHIPLPKLLLRVRRAHARRHNHILALLPINRRHNTLLVAHLQAINDAQHFGGVPAGGGRVHHGQADLFGWVDDEDGADGESDSAFFGEAVDVLLRDHVVKPGDGAVCVGDDGELQGGGVDFVDVGDPGGVRGEVVGGLGLELEIKALEADVFQHIKS
jgi:hypothetical protein